jgi:hypothetical protein
MADYYPLISRAVAGLEKNSGENRRALYERARAALLAQLRGVTPALDESDITRERLALEESIRKVEAEAARQFVEASRQSPAARIRAAAARTAEARGRDEPPASKTPPPEPAPAEPRQRKDPEPSALPPRRYVNPPPPAPPAQDVPPVAPQEFARRPWEPSPSPPTMPEPWESDDVGEQPSPAEPSAAAPVSEPRSLLRRLAGDRIFRSDAGRKEARDDVVSEKHEADAVPARAERPAAEPSDRERLLRPIDRRALERPGPLMFDQQAPQERMFEPQAPHEPQEPMFEPRVPQQPEERGFEPQALREAPPHQDFSEPPPDSSYSFDDAHPAPPYERRGPPPIEDEFAYEEADHDEVAPRRSYRDLIKGLAVAVVIIGVGGLLLWQWPNLVGIYRSFRAPAVETARDQPPPAATTRPKIADRIEPGTQQAPATTAPAPGVEAPAAQKVVLYEEDPADPNGKRFVGSAIWRTETVTPGPGQPPELAIRADVEVPERKLAMTWSLRRNTDKGLPATHTVEIMFKLPADFPSGGISNVPGILMKQAEQTRGVPLAGLAVKVTPAFYLIGLSNMDADKDRNLQLLKERAWFDIPVVYNNNRRAILALEKGSPGERVFADAFKAWKQ